ncbi:MAG: universal stress protein [Bacteroidota bacterium]
MKKILIPTDFSEVADRALEVAVNISRKVDAQLIVLHVIEHPSGGTFNASGEINLPSGEEGLYMIKLVEKAKRDMAGLMERDLFEGVNAKQELQIGNPFHGIRDIVTEHDVDLIVMGTLGASGLEEILVGSNAEKVVRHAACPVLSVTDRVENFDFKDIVFATGMTDEEAAYVDVVKTTQAMYGATVHIVRINTPNNFQTDRDSLQQLNEFATKVGFENFTVNVFNDVSEEEGIVYFSESINADMIALATHGRTGFAHLLSGSIAEDVVNHSKRPVLTFNIKKAK